MKLQLLFAMIVWMIPLNLNCSRGQELVPNYDESKVPAYPLPDLLVLQNGTPVTDSNIWHQRRSELLELFQQEMFGSSPPGIRPQAKVIEQTNDAVGGKARRKQVELTIVQGAKHVKLNLLIYTPATANQGCPVFLGLNFKGNHTITADNAITIVDSWVPNEPKVGIVDNRSTEQARGMQATRWPIETIVDHGFGLVTCYYGDIDPDFDDGFRNGVHALFPHARDDAQGYSWGSIAGWAWGVSRIMDYLETDGDIMADRVALLGHSRLGKTALWAGATDPRFALVVSNNSGCGGAALSKRVYGETVGRINQAFPHWFCERFKAYNRQEAMLPFDQHMLIALMAPRPCYIASAVEDKWADPYGEFLAARAASPAYELFGLTGLSADQLPKLNHPVGDSIGYHIRAGVHDVTEYDWEQFLPFALRHWGLQ